jgi:hypothetical protein
VLRAASTHADGSQCARAGPGSRQLQQQQLGELAQGWAWWVSEHSLRACVVHSGATSAGNGRCCKLACMPPF